MSKTFILFFENDDVDGQQIMQALRKMKGYHHVQDCTDVKLMEELAALRLVRNAALKLQNAQVELATALESVYS